MTTLTPKEIVQHISKSTVDKGDYGFIKTSILSFLSGAYISMGALLAILIGYGFPEIAAGNPGVIKILMGAVFPVGLMLVILAGGELFTGNNALFIPSVMSGHGSWSKMFRNWGLSWGGNFIGAIFFAYFLVYLPQILSNEIWVDGAIKIAETKVSSSFGITFLKGIGANWLVCLAVWLATSARSTSGKILGIWFPIMTFIAIGYEHCVANMFFIPLGMMQGADISISELFIKNLIPSTLGNIVGGSFFVGMLYWYAYEKLKK